MDCAYDGDSDDVAGKTGKTARLQFVGEFAMLEVALNVKFRHHTVPFPPSGRGGIGELLSVIVPLAIRLLNCGIVVLGTT